MPVPLLSHKWFLHDGKYERVSTPKYEEKKLDSLLKRFHSGSINVVLTQQNFLNESAMGGNVFLLLIELHI